MTTLDKLDEILKKGTTDQEFNETGREILPLLREVVYAARRVSFSGTAEDTGCLNCGEYAQDCECVLGELRNLLKKLDED